MTPEVTLLVLRSTLMGYGRAGVKLGEALQRAGVDVFDIQQTPNAAPPGSAAELLEGAPNNQGIPTGTRAKDTNVICWVGVPGNVRGWWEGQHVALLTMWEADLLPEGFRDTLAEFKTVLVPSLQNMQLFANYHPNVRYVPLGIDPADWTYTPRRAPTTEFRFLIGGSGPRKGTDLAYRAFKTVFGGQYEGPRWTGKGPAPRLVMKQPKPEAEFYAPWLDLISGRISNDEEQALYETAHCYLQPARGEGFGLQPLQAIAQGLPTILTDAHGHAGYAHLGIPISATKIEAGYFAVGNPPGMKWWEPDFEELCEAMHAVYTDYEKYQGDAVTGALQVARHWTWDNSAEYFVEALGDDLSRLPPLPTKWHQPTARRFRVRVNRRWAADIGALSFIFEPGRDYYETADVKRILFESGLLDPECLGDDDHGLTETQLAQIEDYSAAHAHCPTCGQRLGSQPSFADDLERAMS